MNRPALSDITESVEHALASSSEALSELASTAVERAQDLAAGASDHVPDAVRERIGLPARRRSRRPWLLLVLAVVAGAAIMWYVRRDTSEPADSRPPGPRPVPSSDDLVDQTGGKAASAN